MSFSIAPYGLEVDGDGVSYMKIRIEGDGFCGYRCFAYSVYDDAARLIDIISDCNQMLQKHPELFHQRCDKMLFSQYCQAFVDHYDRGAFLPQELWMDSAQILSLAVLYDIAVFCLHLPQRKWAVYNQLGSRGYVCLVNSSQHFEVLVGTGGTPPTIPKRATWQNIDQTMMPPFCHLNIGQSHYPFKNVWKWPRGMPEPVMSYDSDTRQVINVNIQLLRNTDVVVQPLPACASLPTNIPSQTAGASAPATQPQPGASYHDSADESSEASASGSQLSNASSVGAILKSIPDPIKQCDICKRKVKGRRGLNMHLHKVEVCKNAYLMQLNKASNRPPDTQISGLEKVEAYLAGLPNPRSTCASTQASASANTSSTPESSVFKKPHAPKLTSFHLTSGSSHVQFEQTSESISDLDSLDSLSDDSMGKCPPSPIKRAKRGSGRQFKGKKQGTKSVATPTRSSLDFSDNENLSVIDENMSVSEMSTSPESNSSVIRRSARLQKFSDEKKTAADDASVSRKERTINKAEQLKKDVYNKYPPIKPQEVVSECPLYHKLKCYHDSLSKNLSHLATLKVTEEISKFVANIQEIGTAGRKFTWSKQEQEKLTSMTKMAKNLKVPPWPWAAEDGTAQGKFNDARLRFWYEQECQFKVLHCPDCDVTCLLVGLDQIQSRKCVDCLTRRAKKSEQLKAWQSVKPKSTLPRNGDKDLPELSPGDKAVIAAVHPVVTIQRNYLGQKKFKQESITLLHTPEKTWANILPRSNLKDRFLIVEKRFKKGPNKYIVANPNRVKVWLDYLFGHHKHYMQMKANGLLSHDVSSFQPEQELATVIDDLSGSSSSEDESQQPAQYAMDAGLSKKDIYSFDHYPHLYLKAQHKMKLEKDSRIRIIRGEEATSRRPSYDPSISDNLAFPHLFPHGENTPTDFPSHVLNRALLKKILQYAQITDDGHLKWTHAEDGVFLMHQFARVVEREVSSMVGWYVQQRPETANIPLQSLLQAFKEGASNEGLIESQMPDLQGIMSKIRNTRENWYAQRLGIETISRDFGDANIFLTINMEPRAWPDVRNLLYKLENGVDSTMPADYFEKDTQKFTELLDKYAWQISVYLYRKVKLFFKAFLCDICHVSADINKQPLPHDDIINNSWYWARVEFTASRGVQHWHCLARVPYILDTGILGRIIHVGRVIRQEIKCGNVKSRYLDEAWNCVEMGLLASRYITVFAESISQASFFCEPMSLDEFDAEKVINIEKFRDEYDSNYIAGNISLQTHPIMRDYRNNTDCDPNLYIESAKVAAVSCMHQCILQSCGGEQKTGSGCRFGFPKKQLKYTVPAVLQVNSEQMEVQVLLRRTCDRVPNLSRYLLRYLRSNHDLSVLVDVAHKTRYAAKYVAKSGQVSSLLEEVVCRLEKMADTLFPPTTQQTMRHLLLASCAHNAYMSKSELAYKALDLPVVIKTFPDVKVIGAYNRANILETIDHETHEEVVEYSDRSEYSAYAERCRPTTQFKGFEQSEIAQISEMNFRTFCETVGRKWIQDKSQDETDIDPLGCHRKLRSRDINSGHWLLTKNKVTVHVRPSTVISSEPASHYEPPSQTDILYHDLDEKDKKMLARAYQELVWYVPWNDSPDKSFLTPEVQEDLVNADDPELKSRYSRRRLEAFHSVYLAKCASNEVAKPGTNWHRDNQYSFTSFLATRHNRDIHLDRLQNKGVLPATYEETDELVDTAIELRPVGFDNELDSLQYPDADNFLPMDILNEIQSQPPLQLEEISVAFPSSVPWQKAEEMVKNQNAKAFLADPPLPAVPYEKLTPYQKVAIDLIKSGQEKILYITGKAGTGKTSVALNICQMFKGAVQAGAPSGLAARSYRGPTIHTMFGWSHLNTLNINMSPAKLDELRQLYANVKCFVIDEVDNLDAASLALVDEAMSELFCSRDKHDKIKYEPFGGKIVIFLGDPAQLKPVMGAPIWGDASETPRGGSNRKVYRSTMYIKKTKRGQQLYRQHLLSHCILLKRGQRNAGLLQVILDRLRNGTQSDEDLEKLVYLKQKFPNVRVQYGVHYNNEMCAVYNYTELWEACKASVPPRYMHISRAKYFDNGANGNIIAVLSRIPATDYGYAQDVLCVTEGADIRLIRNVNVNAGLVNSAVGRVVKVLYDNADVQSLINGQYPSPFCIVADFPTFSGFPDKDIDGVRKYPFPHQPTWVPLFPEKFQPKTVPTRVRKLQNPSSCWRQQFPVDLSRHLTAHRSQGQTWKDSLVSVDLSLGSPSAHVPSDTTSILYVACSRVNELKNLFVAPIHPAIWKKLGNTEADMLRRLHEQELQKSSAQFARRSSEQIAANQIDFRTQYEWEHADDTTPGMSDALDREWNEIRTAISPPADANLLAGSPLENAASSSRRHDLHSPSWMKPVRSERHIGVDQGIRNFAITAVDKIGNERPRVVGVELYDLRKLGLAQDVKQVKAASIVILLSSHTKLLNWMQQNGTSPLLPPVDRVVVHIEQMAKANKLHMEFGIKLGSELQRLVDPLECVVKLSQPNIHRANGPMFKLGPKIIRDCALAPSVYGNARQMENQQALIDLLKTKSQQKPAPLPSSDVEPSDDESGDDERTSIESAGSSSSTESDFGDGGTSTDSSDSLQRAPKKGCRAIQSKHYRARKQMSASVFKYVINATDSDLEEMQLTIDSDVQRRWQNQKSVSKFDDLGDSLLHALNDILCGSSNYRQLVPSTSALHTNRTVILEVMPTHVFYVVLHCSWNVVTIEYFDTYDISLASTTYQHQSTIDVIRRSFAGNLHTALTVHCATDLFHEVADIQIVVKMLKGYDRIRLTSRAAGALTQSTFEAVKSTVLTACEKDSVKTFTEKLNAARRTVISTTDGRKFSVCKSAGKHTNAILSCMEWMRQNVPTLTIDRQLYLDNAKKELFFNALKKTAESVPDDQGFRQLEKVRVGDAAIPKFCLWGPSNSAATLAIADLILIGLNQSEHYVSAISTNFRKPNSHERT